MAAMTAIGIVVSDMEASRAFYELLGLDVPATDEGGHLEIDLGTGVTLMLDTEALMESFDPNFSVGTGRPRVTLAFQCGSPEAVDTTHAEIVGAGHRSHLDPFDAFWGQRYATVLDPDGTAIDLFAPSEDAS